MAFCLFNLQALVSVYNSLAILLHFTINNDFSWICISQEYLHFVGSRSKINANEV